MNNNVFIRRIKKHKYAKVNNLNPQRPPPKLVCNQIREFHLYDEDGCVTMITCNLYMNLHDY